MVHELKTDSAVFQAVECGLKTFEIRKDDRAFNVGDTLLLRETLHDGEAMADGAPLVYTGKLIAVYVPYVLRGPVYGLAAGWCIMSIVRVHEKEE